MPNMIRELIKEHHAYYEVLPYYVLTDGGSGSPAGSAHRVQAGFDIDIYGVRTDNLLPSDSPKYELGYLELRKIAEETSHHIEESCSVEVISFPSSISFDTQNHFQSRAMLRIRISHWRGLDQPADLPEEHALQEVERELQARGIRLGPTSR